MRRTSIRRLMAFVIVVAIGLAALKNADELWAGMMLLLALAATGVAALGGAIMRGRHRCWWAGFAFFAGVYLALADAPWLSDAFESRLGTTHLLDHVHARMFGSSPQALGHSEVRSLSLQEQELESAIAGAKRLVRDPSADPAVLDWTAELASIKRQLAKNKNAAPRLEHFRSVGHCLFALLAGLVGGAVAVWFYGRRDSNGSDAVSPPTPSSDLIPGGGSD